MTLDVTSVEWAIDFVADHSDGDLFPRILEIEAIRDLKSEFVALTANKPLADMVPGVARRFIVPKDDISYRQATQLDPQDSILLSAVIHQFGLGIENRRLPPDQVFSYRFKPSVTHGLYDTSNAWNRFWSTAKSMSKDYDRVIYCDIADFYNQIYHHVVENQLGASGFPNQAINWVVKLLESTTAGVSRGVPVGPHGIHLIAEASMIPIDNSMHSNGLTFLRFVDDILIFCDDDRSAKRGLMLVASILDKQQRLHLQQMKTRILSQRELVDKCEMMEEDRPISADEDNVLKIIRRYSGGNPYKTISYNSISPQDWMNITEDMIERIIREYIYQDATDYVRLRWFFRRLTQIGHPGAVRISLDQLEYLGPCLANICTYFASLQNIEPQAWMNLGGRLIDMLDDGMVQDSEFFRLSILSLFSKNAHLNHFQKLSRQYSTSDSYAKREILLAARNSAAADWLRDFKEDYSGMDDWMKRAFIYGCSEFPMDERRYFVNRQMFNRPFDSVLAKWVRTRR